MLKVLFDTYLLLGFIAAGLTHQNLKLKPNIIEAFTLNEGFLIHNQCENYSVFDEYKIKRENFIKNEKILAFGSNVTLNNRENKMNAYLMNIKEQEFKFGFKNPSKFTPSRHFFEVLNEIQQSKLFKLIKEMPKGAVLHAHDTALCNTDYLLTLTYEENLWQCNKKNYEGIYFMFSLNIPVKDLDICDWKLVKTERKRFGNNNYDAMLKKHFSMFVTNSSADFSDINQAWDKFMNIFGVITPMLTYLPIWKMYFKQALTEFYKDNVMYLEVRTTLPLLYDLEGNNYTQEDTLKVYIEALNEFKKQYPKFFGAKFIFAPNRYVKDEEFEEYIKTVTYLKNKYPSAIAGFDLVAQEDKGRPLIDFAEHLLNLPKNINFYFHAGETNWYGSSTDENLIDAVLLGTKRIGHGYAVIKHPLVLKSIVENDIAIEINPISNQVLKLVVDQRNHPCSYLFANNYPVVVSSDDPSFWGATPLSHDFYIAFLGIASRDADLRTLKQLALNSIKYSSLTQNEKKDFIDKWTSQWNNFIEGIIERHIYF